MLAYYRDFQPVVNEFNAYEFIFTRLNISDPGVRYQILNEGGLNTTFSEIQNDLAAALECYSAPCDKKYLAQRQFYQSAVTNLTSTKYKALKVDAFDQVPSVASFPENAALLGNRIPEITGFYHKHFNYSGFVFVGEQESLFSGNKGNLAHLI